MAILAESDVLAAWPEFASLADDERAALIAAAAAAVEDHCGRTFEQTEATERYDGTGTPRLWLRRRPVVSVDAVTVNGEAVESGGWEYNPLTGELFLGLGRAHPYFDRTFPPGRQNVEVTYTAGWDPVPAPVKRAALMVVRHLHETTEATGALSSEEIGDYSYTLASQPEAIPVAAETLLFRYVQVDAL